MIGLGVGIDYALFILTRFRACLHEGASSEDACATALTTAGRAVLFAGVTVCISMLGLFIMGISVRLRDGSQRHRWPCCVTMVASVTLLPALLGFAGPARRPVRAPRSGLHARRSVTRLELVPLEPVHPTPPVAGGLGCTCRAPACWRPRCCRCGSDPPTPAPTRRAARPARPTTSSPQGFGPGFNGPLLLAAEIYGTRPT